MNEPTSSQTHPAIESNIGRGIDRRRFLQALAATPLLYGLLTSCGSTSAVTTEGPNEPNGNGTNAGSSGPQSVPNPQSRTESADPAVAAAAINAFGSDLLGLLSGEVDGTNENVVCSPASIAIALGMTLGGAAGETRTEMVSVLHADGSSSTDHGGGAVTDAEIEAFHSSMNSLLVVLSERNRASQRRPGPGQPPDEVQLDFANSLWGRDGINWNPAFLDLLAEQYGAGLEVVDFAGDPAGATDAINAWVAGATHNRVTDLIPEGELSDQTRLVLTNAVYLKATWKHRFDPYSTYDRDFTTGGGEVVSVPTMHLSEQLHAVETENWTAVELPYAFNDLSLLVAVGPDPMSSDAPQIDDILDQIVTRDVELSIPKFDLESRLSLFDDLDRLGMPSAFNRDDADFSAMSPDDALFITAVIHQADITVDEDGTEAAAATAVIEDSGAEPDEEEPPPPLIIDVDKPFTFWLRDRSTGAVIFTGRVNDPRQ